MPPKTRGAETVSHAWAHGLNGSKLIGRGTNVFAEGDTIYSFGRHFPMAKRVREGVYFYNPRDYSRTTSKHQHYVRGAIPHGAIVIRMEPDRHGFAWTCAADRKRWRDTLRMLEAMRAKALDRIAAVPKRAPAQMAKARAALVLVVDTWKTLHATFSYPCKLAALTLPSDADISTWAAEEQKRIAHAARLAEADADRRRKLGEVILYNWHAGGPDAGIVKIRGREVRIGVESLGADFLRIAPGANPPAAETSRGVLVPLAEVCAVLRRLRAHGIRPPEGEVLDDTGFRLSSYGTVKLSARGIVVGCHCFAFTEVERFRLALPDTFRALTEVN